LVLRRLTEKRKALTMGGGKGNGSWKTGHYRDEEGRELA